MGLKKQNRKIQEKIQEKKRYRKKLYTLKDSFRFKEDLKSVNDIQIKIDLVSNEIKLLEERIIK